MSNSPHLWSPFLSFQAFSALPGGQNSFPRWPPSFQFGFSHFPENLPSRSQQTHCAENFAAPARVRAQPRTGTQGPRARPRRLGHAHSFAAGAVGLRAASAPRPHQGQRSRAHRVSSARLRRSSLTLPEACAEIHTCLSFCRKALLHLVSLANSQSVL